MRLKNKKGYLNILGGGPTGLALGYFAKKYNFNFSIYEKSSEVGGNCKTIKNGEFRFDTGAHRFHDKHDDVTFLVKDLLKGSLLKVNKPSQIYHRGSMINFPVEIPDVIQKVSSQDLKNILKDLFILPFKKQKMPDDFKQMAYSNYGKTISNLFLLNYTEKLWGEKTQNLSIKISGGRLRSHNFSDILKSILFKDRLDQNHLDGEFYYPKNGFGEIFEKLTEQINFKNIHLNSPIRKIDHESYHITNFDHGKGNVRGNGIFLNTLPLKVFIDCLNPAPPQEIISSLNQIMFRDLKVCVLFLNIPSFSKNASIYYPDSSFPFTRIYEPKNRSKILAPRDKTCILIEVPCTKNDNIHSMNDEEFFSKIFNCLLKNKLVFEKDLINHQILKMENAYPIIKVDTEKHLKPVFQYLKKMKNLYNLGRNANFEYMHTHEIFRRSQRLICQLDNFNNKF
jgi:protoporphyrinogen oxidase